MDLLFTIAGIRTIERGKKAPVYDGWNVSPFPAESIEALESGAGLLHSLSGTCALDIDNMELARPWLAERGVNVDLLMSEPSAVMISSGRPGRAKLLYQLKKPLRTMKPRGSGLELRCASSDGRSVQDVLPPTIHPDTKKPYEWKYGDELIAHWTNPPPIPAVLWKAWNDLLAEPIHVVEDKVQEKPIETVRAAMNNYIASRKLDVTDYNQWLEVGMRLHKQTGGSEEGLLVWNEWSRTDTSKRADGSPCYQGWLALKTKWLTFNKDDTGIGMEGMFRELPAEAGEFPEVPMEPAPEEENTTELLKKAVKQKRAEALARLEERLIYVRGSEKYFDVHDPRIIQTDSALQHLFMPMMPRGKGGTRIDPVRMLKESTTKTVVDRLGFHPGEGLIFTDDYGDRFANIYRNRLPEPVEPTTEEREIIEWLFDRIDDPVFREYYLGFLGQVVQKPGVKIKSAPLIWSDTQGNGKSTLVQTVPSLLVGTEYSTELTGTTLADAFTGYLLNAWHVTLKEFRAGSRGEREAISKKVEAWISDDTVNVRPMHHLAFTMPNRFFVTASSNADDAAAINNHDRKWAITEMKAAPMTPREQEWVYDFLNKKRHAAAVLRHYFANIDIRGFSPSARAPITDARVAMVAANAASDLETLIVMWEQREPPFDRDVVITSEVMAAVHKRCPMKPSLSRLAKLLSQPPINGQAKQFRVAGDKRYRGVIVRNLDKWAHTHGKVIWDHIQGNDDVGVDDPLLA